MSSGPTGSGAPGVSVVVATRNRPDLLMTTLAAIAAQDYPGPVDVLVVFDQSEPDDALVRHGDARSVRVLPNVRRPGLAGGRNTGILAAEGELLAFCDDDDVWHPGRLSAQVAALQGAPQAVLATCGIRVLYDEHAVDRPLPQQRVTLADLLRSRLTELHPSTFLLRRALLLEQVGLVEEQIPGSYAEDYEFLLRIARVHDVVNVPDVLVDILWHRRSYFDSRWETIATALEWLLEHYPEFDGEPRGKARVLGQIAFAHAARGERRSALRCAARTARLNPREGRAYLALAVATGAVGPDRILRALHARGRGI
ncbi:MAG TPA: glycosyltransferase family A protein [Mycobacteriales bacterium]|nr:glycosyltransferase family A protein [Mycobacteriales bacterium]